MPPCSAVHRFCIIVQAILSEQEQVIFMPLSVRSTLKVQRGTIMKFIPLIGEAVPLIGAAPIEPIIPGIVIPGRSIIIALDMWRTPFLEKTGSRKRDRSPAPPEQVPRNPS